MAIVPFVMETVGKCKCPVCPVQSESKCAAGLKNDLIHALTRNPLQKEEVPGAYCATGQATCTDLDPEKSCICGMCEIYTEYTLSTGKPGGKFCAKGMAEKD